MPGRAGRMWERLALDLEHLGLSRVFDVFSSSHGHHEDHGVAHDYDVVEDLASVGVTQADWDAFVERANAAIKKHQYPKGVLCRIILPMFFPPPQRTATGILGVLRS